MINPLVIIVIALLLIMIIGIFALAISQTGREGNLIWILNGYDPDTGRWDMEIYPIERDFEHPNNFIMDSANINMSKVKRKGFLKSEMIYFNKYDNQIFSDGQRTILMVGVSKVHGALGELVAKRGKTIEILARKLDNKNRESEQLLNREDKRVDNRLELAGKIARLGVGMWQDKNRPQKKR
ncbi:MAG TPA: hypothetical protein VJN02_12935 [Gammaproteobacteria bacterium]|nr:hypothetical protein [Gammaproteobacteria bacterium]